MRFWICRDYDGYLTLHDEKPEMDQSGRWSSYDVVKLPKDWFPEVTFESSPQQVEIKLIENERNK